VQIFQSTFFARSGKLIVISHCRRSSRRVAEQDLFTVICGANVRASASILYGGLAVAVVMSLTKRNTVGFSIINTKEAVRLFVLDVCY
jgi:hypothetical protein